MARARYASLLDDPDFLAEIEKIEVHGDVAVAPVDRWFVEPRPAQPSRPAPPPVSGPPAILTTMIGVAGFFFMMGLGAALAVYVFADRVALILHR